MTRISEGRKRELDNHHFPSIALTHSQALWTLQAIGLSHGADLSTFAYYVKSLRLLGIPFDKREEGAPRKWRAYRFEEMMELAVALALRVFGTLPDAIPAALRTHRRQLYVIYRQVISESAFDRKYSVRVEESSACEISGVYLELGLAFEDAADRQSGSSGGVERP